MTSRGNQCLAYGEFSRDQVGTPSKEGLYSTFPGEYPDPGSLGLGGASRGRERENRGTLCEPRSYCVTAAVPIGHRLATELDHLVQPQLPAVDGGGLRLQGNDELLRVLGGGQARLEGRETER